MNVCMYVCVSETCVKQIVIKRSHRKQGFPRFPSVVSYLGRHLSLIVVVQQPWIHSRICWIAVVQCIPLREVVLIGSINVAFGQNVNYVCPYFPMRKIWFAGKLDVKKKKKVCYKLISLKQEAHGERHDAQSQTFRPSIHSLNCLTDRQPVVQSY